MAKRDEVKVEDDVVPPDTNQRGTREPSWDDDDDEIEEEEVIADRTAARRRRPKKDVLGAEEIEGMDDYTNPIDDLQQQLDAGADMVQVWRVPGRGSREYIDSFDATVFNLQDLRNQYGPGKYYIRLRRQRRWMSGGFTVSLAARAEDMERWTPAGGGAMSGVYRSNNPVSNGLRPEGNSEMMMMLRLLLEERKNAPAQGGGFSDIMVEMTKGAIAQTTALMAVFAEMQGGKKDGSGVSDIVENMRAIMALKEELSGGGDGGDSLGALSLLKPLIGPLAQAMQNHNAQPTSPAVGSEVAPKLELVRSPQPEVVPNVPMSPLQILAPHIEQVLVWAKAGQNPEAWAAAVRAQAPQVADVMDDLYGAYEHDDFFNELTRLWPDVAVHKQWVERFVIALLPEEEDIFVGPDEVREGEGEGEA